MSKSRSVRKKSVPGVKESSKSSENNAVQNSKSDKTKKSTMRLILLTIGVITLGLVAFVANYSIQKSQKIEDFMADYEEKRDTYSLNAFLIDTKLDKVNQILENSSDSYQIATVTNNLVEIENELALAAVQLKELRELEVPEYKEMIKYKDEIEEITSETKYDAEKYYEVLTFLKKYDESFDSYSDFLIDEDEYDYLDEISICTKVQDAMVKAKAENENMASFADSMFAVCDAHLVKANIEKVYRDKRKVVSKALQAKYSSYTSAYYSELNAQTKAEGDAFKASETAMNDKLPTLYRSMNLSLLNYVKNQ